MYIFGYCKKEVTVQEFLPVMNEVVREESKKHLQGGMLGFRFR